MEGVAIAKAVYSIAIGITSFIAEHDDKDAVTKQISNIVVQIQHIIHPLISQNITNLPLEQCLHGLQSILNSTHEHMLTWKENRSRRLLALINPSAVTQQLKEDREQLMAQFQLLMGAMQIVDHIKGYHVITPPAKVDYESLPQKENKKTVKGKGNEVLAFWEQCIGSESRPVKGTYLCTQLSSWMGTEFNAVAIQRLLLRLDTNNTGYVSLETLQDLVPNGKIKETINTYSADPTLPLLIWIDDDLLGNAPDALTARKAGITVVQIESTFAAKKWLHVNREFIKKHDNPGDIRFISDQVRVESNAKGESYKNWTAGQQITKFIRDEGFLAPILIYTSMRSVQLTGYVKEYNMVGSAWDPETLHRYFDALGARRKDDIEWAKYDG